ncbi:MAG: LPS O-antigen length regulator [Oceanospirillaceae bacterium]|nr:LPS O-antigen length regulator [Oceanospirillaceae bacterium]
MLNEELSREQQTDFLNLNIFWKILWRSKLFILSLTSVFAVASVVFAILLPDVYRSSVIVAPVSNIANNANLNGITGRLGGLASLAGVNLNGANGQNNAAIATQLMKTWDFLEMVVRKHSLEVSLFAATGWDRRKNKLLIDPEIYNSEESRWVRDYDASLGETPEPSSWELYKVFKEKIYVKEDEVTGLLTISVEHYSPSQAKEIVDILLKEINLLMQRKDREQAIKTLGYLNQKLEKTLVSDMRMIFYQLIEEQTKKLMLTEVEDEYVFKILSPAKVPVEKSKPMRALICILITFFGFIISVVLVVLRNYARNLESTL